ncbi:ubiquinone/menaquinone biosynthesis methyltransferase [Mariprofundus micogutta]|uniref:Ubiquinone/menaquinone biosynthesis methyltransferase n=1 Tax=Mariprofundus micogutta TaxID=1921010 RepID=A0A1L8CLU2_9PROT|nr:class I SAM-dependent methyltransferase [Mariprofundus micogutta]GAV19887.1 ubiquinone/menaquinone biosynthesis methyltransferase [Mariprofundus micogutta]
MKEEHDFKVQTAYSHESAEKYDKARFSSRAGMEVHFIELSKVMRLLDQTSKSAKVVEIGCGTGRILMECVEAGYSVDGADASSSMLGKLQEKLEEKGASQSLDVAEAAKLPYEDNSYDVAYTVRLLNQTESKAYAKNVIIEMMRIVRPEGRVLVECVNEQRLQMGRNRRRTTRLKASEIEEVATSSGATVERVEGAFFLGMGSFGLFGDAFSPVVSNFDKMFSRLFPRYCSRIYVTLKVNKSI